MQETRSVAGSARKAIALAVLGWFLAPSVVEAAAPPVSGDTKSAKTARVGQIFIVGNERTMQSVITREVPLYPGQVLNYPDLKRAERNLARLKLFRTSADGGVGPKVTVVDNPADPDDPYKDILINVQEASTGSPIFGVGVNSDGGLTGSIVLNERNFDILCPPTSFDHILNGTAWRGAGQELRLEAVPATRLQRYSATFREGEWVKDILIGVREANTGSLMFGAGVNSDGGLTGSIIRTSQTNPR
jgi:outer membrane protein assembly factor BamA